VTQANDRIDELIATIQSKLYTAVVSDVLDRHGYLDQAMDAGIRPIQRGMRVVGRAHTVLATDIYERQANPYVKEIASIDAVTPGSCVVASTHRSTRTCFWGELLSTAPAPVAAPVHHRWCIPAIRTRSSHWLPGLSHGVQTGRIVTPLDGGRLRLPIECGGVR